MKTLSSILSVCQIGDFFPFINSFIFLGYSFFLTRMGLATLHERLIFSGIFMSAQIILTQLFLGILGMLYLPQLFFLNLTLSSVLILSSAVLKDPCRSDSSWNAPTPREVTENILSPENIALFALLMFISAWLAVEVCLMPPRGFDDLAYHLAPVYEYIIKHEIFLLPVKFYSHFSFPQNAELLFLWPAIFSHSQQWVDGVQLAVALWGVCVIYGLARALEIPAKISAFVAMLFIFTPIVFAQMPSAYIDIITAVFFMTALYGAVMFYKTRHLFYFYSTAFAAGLLLGMKYNQVFFIFSLAPFLLTGGKTVSRKHWLYFALVLLICGGYWYFRNFWVFHTPFYKPSKFEDFEIFPIRSPLAKLSVLWKDPELGTLNGGFGLTFWCLAVPSWFYGIVRAVIKHRGKTERILLWLALPFIMGVVQLLMVSLEALPWCSRYSIFLVPLGLLSLGKVLTLLDPFSVSRRWMQATCILFSFLAVLPLKSAVTSNNRLDRALKHFIQGKYLTEERYIWESGSLAEAWGLLDYLTLENPRGLSCYIAMQDRPLTSPLYGSHLQNRIWNLYPDEALWPDAFIYSMDANGNMEYFGPRITPDEVKKNPGYELIMKRKDLLFFMRKTFMQDPLKRWKLKHYRELYFLE